MLLLAHALSGAVSGSTEAVVYVPVRFLAGSASAGVQPSSDLKNYLPSAREKPLDANGHLVGSWYKFFQLLSQVQLGGGLTLADLEAAISAAQLQATQATANTQAIATQSQTNAEALAAAVQVVQAAALPGSDQIPPVLNSYTELPP